MFGISGYFKKIQSAFAKEVLMREVIKEAILHQTGADLPIKSIAIKSGTITLENISQSLKSAIYIKKQAILKEIAGKQDIRPMIDIR